MNFDVDARTIYLAVHGSRAYGLATPTSDLDVKGVCIEPLNYHFGYLNRFEQQELLAGKGNDCDSVIYSLKKFIRLATDMNPNIVECLFVDEKHILKIDEFGQLLRDNRDLFISKKARHTFAGYAHAQIKRIESHRKWLLDPPKGKPTRTDFGLTEHPVLPSGQLQTAQALVQKHLDRWQFNDMSGLDPATRLMIQETIAELLAEAQVGADQRYEAACRFLGFDENFLELLSQERRYKSAADNWNQYQHWVKTRNPSRAAGEMKSGYDCKNASHALRLMRMCKEILSGYGVIVDRKDIDADELISIKVHGTMKYDDLLTEVNQLNKDCADLYKTSNIMHEPDRNAIDALVVEMVKMYTELHG